MEQNLIVLAWTACDFCSCCHYLQVMYYKKWCIESLIFLQFTGNVAKVRTGYDENHHYQRHDYSGDYHAPRPPQRKHIFYLECMTSMIAVRNFNTFQNHVTTQCNQFKKQNKKCKKQKRNVVTNNQCTSSLKQEQTKLAIKCHQRNRNNHKVLSTEVRNGKN